MRLTFLQIVQVEQFIVMPDVIAYAEQSFYVLKVLYNEFKPTSNKRFICIPSGMIVF